jgi:hypothetical protein
MIRRGIGVALVMLGAAGLAWWSWPTRRPLAGGVARPIFERPDVEAWDVDLVRGGVRVGRMVSVHVDPVRARPRLVLNEARQPLRVLAPEADLVANAGFFTPEFQPTGLLVSEGRVLHPFVDHGGAAGTGVLVWREVGTIRLHARSSFSLEDADTVRVALQAGPRLIEPGGEPGIRADDRVSANRTVVGRDRAGRFVIVVAHGSGANRSGPSLWEMMRLVGAEGLGRVREDLALEVALNLDGGPSTGLHLRPADVALPAGEIVPSALVVELSP